MFKNRINFNKYYKLKDGRAGPILQNKYNILNKKKMLSMEKLKLIQTLRIKEFGKEKHNECFLLVNYL